MGNRPIWLFDPGWQAAMDATGSADMVHLKNLFSSRSWYNLVPDDQHAVVTDGLGEFNGLDYLAAALTKDGGTLIAYLPSARTVTVDLAKLSGDSLQSWWYNPRTGKSEQAGKFPTRTKQKFDPPGEGDWVLVIDDASRRLRAPGHGLEM